ncbi:MAG: efflux RND transporter periplasmic adaptor subunit [Verrucomicrobia bacterium]|nr:efflux RND transporter periplasmic adaptor subunit [Verrucomicrobiota bacterium]
MNAEKLRSLQIEPEAKSRSQSVVWIIFLVVAVISAVVGYRAWPRQEGERRMPGVATSSKTEKPATGASAAAAVSPTSSSSSNQVASAAMGSSSQVSGSVLTVSGYIVNRERIEISPRFLGQVKWIGVRKGDYVTNGQVLVRLDNAEYTARVKEAEGRLANARTAVEKAEIDFNRATKLIADKIETQQALDDARIRLDSSRASVREAEAGLELAKTYLDWTVIRSPIDGVVLEKLADASELVTPQSFGGTRGPSTALVAIADPKDLQVEIDLNEADLAKVYRNQPCKVSPEAYPDKSYDGYVAEIAPEANRQKGTLQVKVQIRNPDEFLTPELSAKVDFIGKQVEKGNR